MAKRKRPEQAPRRLRRTVLNRTAPIIATSTMAMWIMMVTWSSSGQAQDAATALPAGVVETALTLGDSETGLSARLAMPSGKGFQEAMPFAAVVLVHGSGAQGMDGAVGPNTVLRDVAWGLAARGVAVLRYDKRSFARPQSLLEHGDNLTIDHEVVEDARVAIELLRDQPAIDAARVFVVGHSLGGGLVPRIASGVDPPVAGLVALAGLVRPIPETMLQQLRYIADLDGMIDAAEQAQIDHLATSIAALRDQLGRDHPAPVDADPERAPLLGKPLGYWRDLEGYDAPAVAKALGRPMLVVQGGRDYQVTGADLALWRRGLQGTDTCFVVAPTLDHLLRPGEGISRPIDYFRFAIPVDAGLLDALAAWLLDGRCPNAPLKS